MKRTSYRFAAVIGTGVLIAACGSSSSRSVPAASAGGTAGATAGSGSAYGGGSSQKPGASSTKVVAKKNKLGTIIAAGPKQLTVYVFSADTATASNCSGACAKVWAPVPGGAATATPPAQQSLIGTITRSDGTKQATYKGQPLYYFAKDKDDGDAYGQGVKNFGGSWYVVKPSGSKIDES